MEVMVDDGEGGVRDGGGAVEVGGEVVAAAMSVEGVVGGAAGCWWSWLLELVAGVG